MLTILHTESSKGWGGQEIRILQESLGMSRRNYRVLIAAPEDSDIFKRAKAEGIIVIPCEFQKHNPSSFLRVLSLIKKQGVNILNTHSSNDSWVATLAARLLRDRPRIIRTRHLSTPVGKSLLSRLIYDVLPDAVITTGEEIRQRMINDNGFNASRIFSIPTGVDLNRFDPFKVAPAFKSKGFSIGMIGVLRSWKGHRYFIEAAEEIIRIIPEAVFYIVGDGPQYNNIRRLIDALSLKDRVLMLGHREDIPEILASLNVIVHPSYANEGVPQSVLQALAMKRPVVAADVGAIKEVVINGKTGLLISPRSVEEIVERVVILHKNPDYGKGLGNEGRKLIERSYSLEAMLNRIEGLYERLKEQGN